MREFIEEETQVANKHGIIVNSISNHGKINFFKMRFKKSSRLAIFEDNKKKNTS